jgi:hypothetical protein
MNSSSENFESLFNGFENFNNTNSPLTESFSWIHPREPKVFCDGLYCGIPIEKAFAKYENRNITSTTSKYGFNAPVFNERRSMKFKSLASEFQKSEAPKDKRGFTPISSPSGFSDFEPIKGLYKDITLDGAIKSKLRGKNTTSEYSSEYDNLRSSTNKSYVSKNKNRSSQRNMSSTKSSVVSLASSILSPVSTSSSVKSSSPRRSSSRRSSSRRSSSRRSSSKKSSSSKSSSSKSSSI